MPMIQFYAVPERGKSRTGKDVTYICYRGIHLFDIREAHIFRLAENLHATLFFDIMGLWEKAKSSGSQDILLARFEKGSIVTRVLHFEKGPFEDMRHFSAYGPTILATNEPLHKILDSRCIGIDMPNRPGHYENPKRELGIYAGVAV